jgi:hypothetical protein
VSACTKRSSPRPTWATSPDARTASATLRQLLHRDIEHVRHHGQRESPPDDRSGLDEPAGLGREPVDPGTHRVAHGAWRVSRPPGAVDDGAGDLADEERVAVRGVVHLGRRDADGAEGVELPADLDLVQAAQVEPLDVRGSVQVGQRRRERAVRCGVAQCGEQQQRRIGGAVGEEAHHQQGGLVGPVDVVEHDQQRPPEGRVEDRGGDRVDGPEPILR